VYDHGENGMGEEIEYRHDGFIECDGCGNEISFRISGYEYPVGAFNYEDSEITGGSFDKEPHMCLTFIRVYIGQHKNKPYNWLICIDTY
jgi:hypothetical protein